MFWVFVVCLHSNWNVSKPLPCLTLPLFPYFPLFHSLFLTLPSTPYSFLPLCCSISFVVFLLLPAEQRDSVTVAYLCGNHLLHLSSTAGIGEPVAWLRPPLWKKAFFLFQPNQKNVEMHVSLYLQEIGLLVWVTAGLWLCAWHWIEFLKNHGKNFMQQCFARVFLQWSTRRTILGSPKYLSVNCS